MRWATIPGYEGLYEASDSGLIKSVRGVNNAGHKLPVKVLKPAENGTSGHLFVYLYKDGKSRKKYVHRLVLEAFRGKAPKNTEALHLDDNPRNNRLENLQWGTRSENLRSAVANKRRIYVRKTHCKRGHPLVEENTYKGTGNRRGCKICRNYLRRIHRKERRNENLRIPR